MNYRRSSKCKLQITGIRYSFNLLWATKLMFHYLSWIIYWRSNEKSAANSEGAFLTQKLTWDYPKDFSGKKLLLMWVRCYQSENYPTNLFSSQEVCLKLNNTEGRTQRFAFWLFCPLFYLPPQNLMLHSELNTALRTQQVLSTRCSLKKSLASCELYPFYIILRFSPTAQCWCFRQRFGCTTKVEWSSPNDERPDVVTKFCVWKYFQSDEIRKFGNQELNHFYHFPHE